MTAQELRKFGLMTGAIVAGLFGVFLPWLFSFDFPRWPWLLAGVLGLWALLHPLSLAPVYHGWIKVGDKVGWFNSRIILGVLFFAINF